MANSLHIKLLLILPLFPSLSSAISFEDDIFPLFQDYCIDCHGPEKQKSGFRVDRRAYLLKGGDTGLNAIVGDPKGSYLIEVIKSDDPEIGMPPKGGKLFEDEVELLEQWIAEGAVWPGQMEDKVEEGTDHWAFQEIQRPKVPTFTSNPIDSFINRRLSKERIPKSEEADPLTLIRRASIVLTGLPPQPSRVAEFLLNYSTNPQGNLLQVGGRIAGISSFWGEVGSALVGCYSMGGNQWVRIKFIPKDGVGLQGLCNPCIQSGFTLR